MATFFQKVRIVYYNFIQQYIEKRYASASVSSSIHGCCLMFHHISDEPIDNVPSTCQCTTSRFQQSLLNLIDNGYEPLSIHEALKRIDNKDVNPFFIVTFDDIPGTVYTKAYPFLKEHNIPFAVFIAPSLLDKSGYITTQQLIDLSKEPLCTIGAHSVSHNMLRKNDDREADIVDSKKVLEKLLNTEIIFFAYPYGSIQAVDRESIAIAQRNYDCAFSTLYSVLNDHSVRNRWFLPRMYVK